MSVIRPIFISDPTNEYLFITKYISFPWVFTQSKNQRNLNVLSLHSECEKQNINNVLEISTASNNQFGKNLSAFNLKLYLKKYGLVSVESLYQGSKVFENGGPFIDLYSQIPSIAKTDERLKSNGKLVNFKVNETIWELNPTDLFYNWLYFNAINRNTDYLNELLKYDKFSDIMFNMNKSINCQARSCAIIVSLLKLNLFHKVIKDKDTFTYFMKNMKLP